MAWLSPNLSDGLGNQLFQMAASFGAAEKYKRTLVFYLPRCHKASHTNIKHLFSLFPTIPFVDVGHAEWHEISEKSFATFESLPTIPELPVVLRGFRQSEKYFPLQGVSLDFRHSLGESEYNRLTELGKMLNIDAAAFLHVRRGDYTFLPHHQVNLENYWVTSIRNIQSTGQTKLLIFSDDSEYVENVMLPFFTQFSQECVVLHEGPIATLYLMSLCGGGAICANSTFSWWGAYLSVAKRRKAPICMPAKWGDFNTPDIYPEWATVVDV